MAERLSGADAAWLHMDRPTNRMIVNLVLGFDEPPDWDAVLRAFEDRLVAVYPRLRQKVVEAAVPGLAPRWTDDDHFRMEAHVHRARLGPPGGTTALHAYVGERVATGLDPGRPLWELHLLEGYGDGAALLLRAHHAIGDGTALMHAVVHLADPDTRRDQGPPAVAAPPSDDGGGPSGSEAVRSSAVDWVRRFPRSLTGDAEAGRAAVARVRSLAKLAVVPQDRPTLLRATLGTEKAVAWCDPVPVDDVKAAAKDAEATVNDLLLAVVAGALGTYLRRRGDTTEQLGVMLPLNLRPLDKPMSRRLGNRFGLVFPTVPIGPVSPAERISDVRAVMDRTKTAKQANVVFGWISAVGYTHRLVENLLIDRYAGMSSVILTNVAGPRHPLRIAGTTVTHLSFWVPMSGPIGVGISLVSYAGDLTVGVMADRVVVPDINEVVALLEEELTRAIHRPYHDDLARGQV